MAPHQSSRGDSDPYLIRVQSVEVPIARIAQELDCECHNIAVTRALTELVRYGLTRYGAPSQARKEFSDSLNLNPEDPRRVAESYISTHDAWSAITKSVLLPQDKSLLLGASVWVDKDSEINDVLNALRSIQAEMKKCTPIALSLDPATYREVMRIGDYLANQPKVETATRQTWQLARRQLLIASVVGESETLVSQSEMHLINVSARGLEAPRQSKSDRVKALTAELRDVSKEPNSEPFAGDSLKWHYSTALGSWAPKAEFTRYRNSSFFDLSSRALDGTLQHYTSVAGSFGVATKLADTRSPKIALVETLRELRLEKERDEISEERLYQKQCEALLEYLDAKAKILGKGRHS